MNSSRESASARISVLVPAHNESGALPGVIDEIGKALVSEHFECIVIDDGSTDATFAAVRDLMTRDWLRLIRHQANYGKGAAIRSGLLAAYGEIIVVIDADGENDPADIPELVSVLRAGPANLGLVNVSTAE